MLRTSLAILAGLVVLVLTPLAAAQATMKIDTQWSHPDVRLPDGGRNDVGLTVTATVSGTICAAEQTFTVPFALGTFEKWAGASLEPPQVAFKLPAGPVVGETRLTPQETVLNVAWDTETAPRFGAEQEYQVIVDGNDVGKSGGPCLPDVIVEDHTSEPVRVYLEDRPEIVQDVPCGDDPYQPKCTTTIAEPVPPAPAAGPLVLILIVALATLVRRKTG